MRSAFRENVIYLAVYQYILDLTRHPEDVIGALEVGWIGSEGDRFLTYICHRARPGIFHLVTLAHSFPHVHCPASLRFARLVFPGIFISSHVRVYI